MRHSLHRCIQHNFYTSLSPRLYVSVSHFLFLCLILSASVTRPCACVSVPLRLCLIHGSLCLIVCFWVSRPSSFMSHSSVSQSGCLVKDSSQIHMSPCLCLVPSVSQSGLCFVVIMRAKELRTSRFALMLILSMILSQPGCLVPLCLPHSSASMPRPSICQPG